MLKKLIMSVAAFAMVFGFVANDASARVNKSCNKCEPVRVAKVRCPKPKCVKPHVHRCQSGCGTVTAAAPSCSSCSAGSVSDVQHIAPVADPGPAAATSEAPAPVETAPAPAADAAPSPSAAEPAK